jgi:antitoxin YefM
MKEISIAELQKDMKRYFEDVSASPDPLVVRGETEDDAVVLLSIREYNSMLETEHLLSSEANRARLLASIRQMEEGKTTPHNLTS